MFDLIVEDASCTEAWLRISLDSSLQPRTLTLKRDDSVTVFSDLGLLTSDTLVVDTSLLPNQTYNYRLTRQTNTGGVETRTAVATTMDTTSHNFVFQIDTLGDGASSVLYDVAIINDTLAYAVGEIYLRDSLGNWDPNAYNMVKWDGNKWELMRIQFYTFCGQSGTGSYPAKSIFVFSPTDIWIGMDGSQVVRWNGQSQSAPTCTPVSINKLWGDSTTGELYAVGNGGGIAIRSPSATWQRVESGTTLDIKDVWGTTNPRTGQVEVLALASTFNVQVQESMLLQITGNSVISLDNTGLSPSVRGIWFVPGNHYFVVGAGIHHKRMLSDSLWRVYPPGEVTSYHSGGVRGSDVNDVFVAGSFREIVHFNGVSWHRYVNLMPGSSGSFGPVAIRGNLMVTVGLVSQYALVAIGLR